MSTVVLGIEGTAWNLSAALVDENDVIAEITQTYKPEKGGIHPREAAQHHAKHASSVIERLLEKGKKEGISAKDISGIAFSQGPGLGQCLRTVATAARALSISLNVPLIGVNHCIAHIEIGRWKTPSEDPVVLYVSGANSQVLGYRRGRYRIFGETLDIGIGNALDKFARNAHLSHPGGPKIEEYAKLSDNYISMPYVVKGMDFSFSGISTAATDALSRASIEDVCYSLQETAFAMLVEVSERALAHTGKNELLLAGGVGANMRLREMLNTMCEERGVKFYVPEKRFMGDNGAMIAYTGLVMLKSGITTPLDKSHVNPNFRPDTVDVRWIEETADNDPHLIKGPASGAEAVVRLEDDYIIKERIPKKYRLPVLDERIRHERTRSEARLISEARRCGVPTPVICDIQDFSIKMEYIEGIMLKYVIDCRLAEKVGEIIGKMHECGIIHGDLTTSNILFRAEENRLYIIDFGLAYINQGIEAKGVDVHVLFQTFESTHDNHESLIRSFCRGYRKTCIHAEKIISRVSEIKKRGRYA